MQKSATAAGVQPHGLVEIRPREASVRPGPSERREEPLLGPLVRDARGHDLLGQDVSRARSRGDTVELAAAHALDQRGALDQLVQGQREEPSLRDPGQRVPGTADPLKKRRDRTRGADLNDQVDVSDVDAELEGGRGHERAERPRLEAGLRVLAPVAGEAAVVARHRAFAQALGQLAGDPLGHLARVDEDERRPVLLHELVDASVDLVPLLVRAHRRKRRRRHLDRDVELPEGAGIDQAAIPPHPAEEAAHLLQRLLCGRQADALDGGAGFPTSSSSRSRDSARWLPRLSRTMAWISSTITVRTVESIARPPSVVRSRYSDSGVVTRMCGGRRVIAARSLCGVSPVRTSTRSSGSVSSSSRISASGASRFF